MNNHTSKRCTKCGQEKPTAQFSKHNTQKDGLRCSCKQCCADSARLYRETHRGKIIEYHRKYRKLHPEKVRAVQKRCYEKRSSYYRARNASYWHRRRALKIGNGGQHTSSDVQRQGNCQQWRCWWCGNNCENEYHIDHLIPLAKGGHNGPSNIVISCPHCNLSKRDKLPHEWSRRLL